MNAAIKRAKITVNGNDVTVDRYDHELGRRTTTTYFVPHMSNGQSGYVRIRDKQCRFPQVCELLSGSGATLMATAETLPDVIRRELRRLARTQTKQ